MEPGANRLDGLASYFAAVSLLLDWHEKALYEAYVRALLNGSIALSTFFQREASLTRLPTPRENNRLLSAQLQALQVGECDTVLAILQRKVAQEDARAADMLVAMTDHGAAASILVAMPDNGAREPPRKLQRRKATQRTAVSLKEQGLNGLAHFLVEMMTFCTTQASINTFVHNTELFLRGHGLPMQFRTMCLESNGIDPSTQPEYDIEPVEGMSRDAACLQLIPPLSCRLHEI